MNLLETIAREYALDIIDLYREGYPKPPCNSGDFYTVDGVHPTDEGYRVIAQNICSYYRERRIS